MRNLRLALLLFFFLPRITLAQQTGLPETKVAETLVQMKSSQWTKRWEAFETARALLASEKVNPRDLDRLHVGLIDLLFTETHKDPATVIVASDNEREGYSNYFGDLIGTVAELKDARAVPVLLANATTGEMATRGVAHFGKAVLGPVIEQAAGTNPRLAEGALFVIRDMLEYQIVSDSDSLARIKNTLRVALVRPDNNVRIVAVYVIEYLRDREEFVPTLENIAKIDPYKMAGQVAKDGQDNGEVYPVRRATRSLLAKIANHQPPIIDRGVPAP